MRKGLTKLASRAVPQKSMYSEKNKGKYRMTPWGRVRTKKAESRFREWLATINSVEQISKSKRAPVYLRSLPPKWKNRLYARLREVDPNGEKMLRGLVRSTGFQLKRKWKMYREQAIIQKQEQEDKKVGEKMALLEQRVKEHPRISLLKFVPVGGLQNILAMAVAAGYTREQVAELCETPLDVVNDLVTEEVLENVAHNIPKAIVRLADLRVYQDLLKGDLTDTTDLADKIATRRRKLVVDLMKKTPGAKPDDTVKDIQAIADNIESSIKERFGVDRKARE